MQLKDSRFLLSPSDVTGYLGCEHSTTLSVKVALGEIKKPTAVNEQMELVFRKGREHEAAYLARLRAEGKDVVEIEIEPDHDWERAARETEEALASGIDVVYQGVLAGDGWRGVADFLERQPDGTYEAVDTKLARSAKPAYILQLCFYSEQLARIQESEPEQIHVLLGNGERQSFRPQEFAAYARRVRGRLERFVAERPATRAYPCGSCESCDFKPLCDAEWAETDSLCLVAGVGRREMEKLEPAGITTLTGLAEAAEPAGLSADRFSKLSRQAALQLERKRTGRPVFELLPHRADAGFAALPNPSSGDLFFDLEGNPFWDAEGSLEYLWGVTDTDDVFTARWADDRDSERRAFEDVVDLIHAGLAVDPAMHVYHYAGYEVGVLRRLAGGYGTREAEVDDLLRRGVLVDLLKVVRGGLQASVPNYGLKEMEVFLDFPRLAEIRDGGTSIVEYERYMQTHEQAILDAIAAYNREDCISTRVLRDWLLERRAEAVAAFGAFPLPEPVEPKEAPLEKIERAGLRGALLDAGNELAAGLLDYHDRERKPTWWAFFDRLEYSPEELVEDPEAIALLEHVGEPEPDKQSFIYRLTYPAQEHKLGVGHHPFDEEGRHAGEIVALDRDARELALRRGPSLEDVELPLALLPGEPYRTDAQEDALLRIGRSLIAGDLRYPAVESVVTREPFDHAIQTTDFEEMAELLLSLDGRHLVIQGPPGSGKTYVSGRLIARLLAEGKRVGVASTSHKAIHKLLDEHATIPPDRGLFLEQTYRLHPDVCGYISEEFYEGRLGTAPVCKTRTTPLGTGLRWIEVAHEGCRQESPVEAERVAEEVARIIAEGVPAEAIKVVAPYNAQVNLLRELLPPEVAVGTVDKFQGQEARVVLYSMASSSGEDIPHGLEFLLSRNRLNVAISRAQCLAYLVCSPRLLEINCRTIEHMRLANALCRFVEFAGEQ